MAASDRMLGGVALAVGAGVIAAVMDIDVPGGPEALSPRFFPLLLACMLLLFGGALLIRGGGKPLARVATQLCTPRSLCFVGLTALYTLTFGVMDFRVGTAVFMGCAMRVMGSRRLGELCAVPILASLLLYAVFRHGFHVLLPTWWG